jgi:uncharacterized membrane protein YfcA
MGTPEFVARSWRAFRRAGVMSEQLEAQRSLPAGFGTGALIGTLGGLIGLGGAEFRLPVLISLFRFRGLEAVILNKATSLVVVASALPFRAATVPFSEIGAQWLVIVNLLAGSLIGAWVGAEWATRLKSETLYRVIAVLLVVIAGVLLFAHDTVAGAPPFSGWEQIAAGIVAGFVIGVIASLLGVAGGEFLIPTLVLLFGADIKLAGSLSLAVSLPTMLVGFTRFSRDQSFSVLRKKLEVPACHGGRLVRRDIHRRLVARACAEPCPAAIARRVAADFRSQDMAPRINAIYFLSDSERRQHLFRGADDLPLLSEAETLARQSFVTGASLRNWASYGDGVLLPSDLPEWRRHLLTDPQTSGGLLIACAPDRAEAIACSIVAAGYPRARIIGRVEAGAPSVEIRA